MNPLQRLYLRRIERDKEFSRLYDKADEPIKEESVNLIDALYKGYVQDSKLATLLTANPDLSTYLKRSRGNLFKSVQTAKRILGSFLRKMRSGGSGSREEAQNEALMDLLFGELDEDTSSLDAEAGRLNFLLDEGLQSTLEQGSKTDDMMSVFSGRGLEDGGEGGSIPPDALELFSQSFTVDILDAFGHFDSFMRTHEKTKRELGMTEISDVIQGNDLEEILDEEWLEFMHPTARTVFFEKYTEEQLLQFQREDDNPEDNGPVILYVDFSSSMGKFKAIAAGFALAAFKHLEDQERYVEMHIYTTSVQASVNSEDGDLFSALRALASGVTGGTNWGYAFSQTSREWNSTLKRSADVVVITDGQDVYGQRPEDAELLERAKPVIDEMKRNGSKFSCLFIGYVNQLEQAKQKLSELFDSVLMVNREIKGEEDALAKKLYRLTEEVL